MKRLPISFILPSFSGGGAERVVISLVENINENIFDPYLIMQNTTGPLHCSLHKNRITDIGASKFRYALLTLIKRINTINPVIIFSTFPHITILLLIFKKFFHRDILIISREPNMPSISLLHSPFSFIMRNLYNIYMPKIDGVISSSAAMKKELISKGINQNKICIISNPINIKKINNFKKIERYEGNGLRLVYVGRLVYQKGLDRLLPVLKDIPNIHLTIIGDGEEIKRLIEIINKNNIKDKISFLGHIEAPYSYMAGADYLVLPSRWEGLPNVALESLYLGTPVITTKAVVGLEEIKSQVSSNSLMFCKNLKEIHDLLLNLPVREDYKKPVLRPTILSKYNTHLQYSKKASEFMRRIIHANKKY